MTAVHDADVVRLLPASKASAGTDVQHSNSGAHKASTKASRPQWTEDDFTQEETTDPKKWQRQLLPSLFSMSGSSTANDETAPCSSDALNSDVSQICSNHEALHALNEEDRIAADIVERLNTTALEEKDFTAVQTYVRRLAMKNQQSSRALQLVMERATEHENNLLFRIFRDYTFEAANSYFGNFVIQEFIRLHPPARVAWIPRSLVGRGKSMSRGQLGCRIICRLIEHYSEQDLDAVGLLTEVFQNTPELLNLKYGHFVAETGLELGIPVHKKMIFDSIWTNVHAMARGQYSSNVVEKALKVSAEGNSDWLAYALLEDTGGMIETAQHWHGWRIAKTLLLKEASRHTAVRVLNCGRDDLRQSKGGRYVLKMADAIWATYERI